jgi:starch-binding outer membrane protein SusE/F
MLRLLSTLIFCAFFLSGYSQFSTIGLIGDATPGGWDTDTPMEQNAGNPDLWTLDITLGQGEVKFRADGSWDVNWGDTRFPIGIGVGGGPNIPIVAGDYSVSFNSATGEYFFDYASDIGIIGSATPFGWDREVFMFRDADDDNKYYVTLNLLQGAAKFRADGNWDVNWGATDFPSGIGEQNGPDIPVPQAGRYYITFDKSTGEYSFEEQVDFASIGIIGSATPGGWDVETPLNKDSGNPDLWRANVTLTEGAAKFRANDGWAINWGGTAFPSGIAELNGDDIVVPEAGEYLVSFNTNTLAYSFLLVGDYSTVSIIGDATPGGWDVDTPMEQDANDKSIWRLRVELVTGEAKFRADNDWAVNWGGGSFPDGVAELDGPNIPVIGGEYRVIFNSTTGEYSFEEVFEYGAVSLVGKSGPFNEWPGTDDMGARDWFLDKDNLDPHLWSTPSVTLRNFADDTDGGIKFRADTAWTINWGAVDFPTGVGTQNGPNIQPVAGTYSVVFNSLNGEYAFGPEVSTREELLNPAAIKLLPNPASSMVTINIDTDKLGNNINVVVYDLAGRQVMIQRFDLNANLELNVSKLQVGSYLVNITDGKYLIGKQLIIVR